MAIKKIRVSNFKSFRDLEIELGQFNVLVGANASGKSNFVQIFQFLRDIVREGLINAISLQEGVEYLRNLKIGSSKPMAFEIISEEEVTFNFPIIEADAPITVQANAHQVIYEFALRLPQRGKEIEVAQDKITLICDSFLKMRRGRREELGPGKFVVSNLHRDVKYEMLLSEERAPGHIVSPLWTQGQLPPSTLLMETLLQVPVVSLGRSGNFPISIYDFDPKLAKQGIRGGRKELEGNGSNLALVLQHILDDNEGKRELTNLMRNLLPFAADLRVERAFDQSLSFKLRENYSRGYLPASLLSDGTINITALMVTLFFEEKPIIIIEEPERNIHPYLISKIVGLMREAAERQQKQIFVTTHSPEVVKYAGVENLLLISRDKEGFSTISRPKDGETVQIFLNHDLGIEELYLQNLLGV